MGRSLKCRSASLLQKQWTKWALICNNWHLGSGPKQSNHLLQRWGWNGGNDWMPQGHIPAQTSSLVCIPYDLVFTYQKCPVKTTTCRDLDVSRSRTFRHKILLSPEVWAGKDKIKRTMTGVNFDFTWHCFLERIIPSDAPLTVLFVQCVRKPCMPLVILCPVLLGLCLCMHVDIMHHYTNCSSCTFRKTYH